MKKILAKLLLALMAFLPALARADVIYQDTFSYTNGTTADISTNVFGGVLVTNWSVHSGSDDSFIKNHRLEVSSSTAYLGVTATRSGDIHRLFSLTNNCVYTNNHQILFSSFIVNFTNLPTGSGAYFAHFYVNSSTFPCRFWALTNGTVLPNTFRMAIQMGSATTPNQVFPVDLALNTDYQVVMGYDPAGLDAATIWINPTNSTDFSLTTSDAYSPGTSIVNSFGFRQASGFGGFLTVSNLVVATTFDEAATNVVPPVGVPPIIVYQPVAKVFNFPSAVLSLSTVANGQGLGSMAYQWQIASSTNAQGQLVSPGNVTDAGDITGSATSILSFGNAATGDSGFYALVATTPYGLSVTSTVSQVSIVDGPFPPVITIQPVNSSGYQGFPASLSVSVASPPSGGSVSYTWYSNNVVISSTANNNGSQTDNGLSSTYGFTSGLTNYSATYKVAVTNGNPGGVVSSNAVLSIINPPSVSIAFLRTLVDPNNNYQATNSKIAFQVTGVITTSTNITSGNTASYYLQDATAGINIFATFGSTFRPALGDVVTFVGVLSSFSSGLELFADPVADDPSSSVPYTSYTDSGPGVLPVPVNIPFTITNSGFANMNLNVAGRLVELTNVFFGTNAGTVITNGFFTVTNGAGQPFRLWVSGQDQDVLGQTFPTFAYSVSGPIFGSMNPNVPVNGTPNPNFAVAVTKFTDINADVGVNSAVICSGNSATLTAATNGGYNASFYWSPGGQTTQSITVSPAASTTNYYTVTVTNTDTGLPVNSATATVIVNPVPVSQTIRATSANVCSNTPVQISLASSVSGTTYLLTTNPSVGVGTTFGVVPGTNGLAVNLPAVTPKVSVTYWVLATNSGACALTIGSTNITVVPPPLTSAITGPSTAVTNQAGVTYSVAATAGSTYGWKVPTGATFTGGFGSSISVTFGTTSGNVTVTETNATGCTGAAISKAVTLVPLIAVNVTGLSGTNLAYSGGSGLQFVLISSGDLTVLTSAWTRIATNLSSPGTFTIPVGTSTNQFYRIKSE